MSDPARAILHSSYPRENRVRAPMVLLLASLAGLTGAQEITPETLFTSARAAAFRSRNPQTRALCLADMAVAWGASDAARFELLSEEAVAHAHLVRDPLATCLALRSVAVRLGAKMPEGAGLLLAEAAELARALGPVERGVALRELALVATRLRLAEAMAMVSEALEAVRQVEQALVRSAGLRDLASGLTASNPDMALEIFAEARDSLDEARVRDPRQPLARAELAAAWALLDLEAATDVVESIYDPALRPMALATVAGALASVDPDRALAVSQRIPEGLERATVIAAAAAQMTPKLAATAADLARVALSMLGDEVGETANAARAHIAAALARRSEAEAIDVVGRIADLDQRNAALCTVADRVGETQPRRGVELLEPVDDPVLTEPVACRLAIGIARESPQDAVLLAQKLRSQRLRVTAYIGILSAIRPKQDEE